MGRSNKTEAEIKKALRAEMREEILMPNEVEDRYNIALMSRYVELEYAENVPLHIPRRVDNMLRNFAYARRETPSNRLSNLVFLKKIKDCYLIKAEHLITYLLK